MKSRSLYKLLIIIVLLFGNTIGGWAQEMLNRQYAKNQIRDLALIYQGNDRRPKWDKTDLLPYVVHTFADGHSDWTFDGFLFLEFDNNNGISFTPTIDRIATKENWQWYIDKLFTPGVSLDALDSLIDSLKSTIGAPGFKHKIVLTILTPTLTTKQWGEVDGKNLDMSKYEDAALAAKWYIDEIVNRFNQHNYKNLELSGLYWLDEDMCATYDLAKYIAPIVHSHNLDFIWIPYYNARGIGMWREYGFDTVYLQPNYLFDKRISDLRLKDTTDMAYGLGIGLELEMDQTSLFNAKNSTYQRFEDYIDYYLFAGVWNNSAIAYYTGNHAIAQMAKSGVAEDQRLLDKMFSLIVKRRSNKNLLPNISSKL